jgi:hypothetical protein
MTELFDFHAGVNGGAAHYLPKVLRRLPVALVALAVAVTGTVVVVTRAAGHHRASAAAPVQTTLAPTTLAPTTTTIDPGLLPQTRARPTGTDPAFQARMRLLWNAISTGHLGVALPAFFPLNAYKMVKAFSDPASDWLHRLIAEYDADISAVHASLGSAAASATLLSVSVPDAAATWVDPGAELNKIGYWRVYNTTLNYSAGGVTRAVVVISLISWRGQWYVVHFRTKPS